ncbi:MAG: H-NS histone family protein [Sphingobacteriia bacterium]|nr:H-NS histone family protein [Sphingobacteriia bacterium]NCC40287.1 H-NS histone family protein [Gammaproteobacteria bacterium]
MLDLSELLAQKEEIERQIRALRKEERRDAITEAKRLIAEYELTPEQLFAPSRSGKAQLPPKYIDPDTGKTWSGKGRVPGWLDGKNRDDFLIV